MSSSPFLSVWKPDLFKGKVAFITGGAGTICRRQAEALIVLGCSVAIIGRNEEKTAKAAQELDAMRSDVRAIGIGSCDVCKIGDLSAAVQKTTDQLGKIDFVICGAAGNFIADFNSLSANAFKKVVDIDLLGSFNTVKACYRELKKNQGAVLFVSATFHYYGVPFQSHVGAAKAGVDALSNALAVELGPIGVRVNAIAPGAIGGTEGYKRLSQSSKLASKIPCQRLGSTDDIAQATVFLFSDAAKYITGTVQIVDGGFWHMGPLVTADLYPGELLKRLSREPKL
ncbi:hypothetical protein OGAPHI_002474 [Ogataea philodendri]|uniref:2,4-dienoyl-CoA reductase [(3E)-enoyl-CoA-producing] n=1 Tax=Ogataea philodendri TaxID=1378263 RepID=A0A9P8T814_9ASCO|nr:uncharacterized protein OGAPHI_002474 [Ogataea philodendri]KAH3668720.1 hypothetical protein OGAPHI_002474 [Ogataea philodendri]